MLIGSEINDAIPCLPYAKDILVVQFEPFIVQKQFISITITNNGILKKSLRDVLTYYIKHKGNGFDYINHVAHRKHVFAIRVRYTGKESKNLDDTSVLSIDPNDYLEF